MDKYEKLAELIANEEEAKSIFVASVEETKENLKSRGLDFTEAELVAFSTGLNDANSDELNEEALEYVAGGARSYAEEECYRIGKKVGKGLKWVWRIGKGLILLGLL